MRRIVLRINVYYINVYAIIKVHAQNVYFSLSTECMAAFWMRFWVAGKLFRG